MTDRQKGTPKYVTTPIYYVNDKPHIGHAYCTVLTDTYRRFYKLFGHDTYFLTGVDEHGQKVQDAAKKRGISPQEHCDDMQAHFRDLWPTLNIEVDDFIRTTEPRHEVVVQKALQALYDKGDIYRDEYEGWYSPWVEKFFTEDELVDGKCPETGKEVNKIKETNYFFRMSRYEDALRQHIIEHPDFIVPDYRKNEVMGFLKKGLRDLCISRPKSRLSWGVTLPFDTDYVTYVWFDALLNYASAIGLYTDDEKFRYWWQGAHHFIGKDILTTHSVYWTTMLLALELPLPQHIIATGWWLTDNTKMSKSLGNAVSPLDLREKYGVDSLRYFLMRGMVIGQDANFSEVQMAERCNGDLANDFGNLLSRVTKLANKQFGPVIPTPGEYTNEDRVIIDTANTLPGQVQTFVEAFRLDQAMEEVLKLMRMANKYVTDQEPWKVFKTDEARAATIAYVALQSAMIAAALMYPIIPQKAEEMLNSLSAGVPASIDDVKWGSLKPGEPIELITSLFPRIDLNKLRKQIEDANKKPEPAKSKPEITIDDFAKIDLRTGKVLTAEPVEGSSKLIKMQVDLGAFGTRQIVGGLGQQYDAKDLVGKTVVVLANLKPRKLFGLESQGMLLAAGEGKVIALLEPDKDVNSGSGIS